MVDIKGKFIDVNKSHVKQALFFFVGATIIGFGYTVLMPIESSVSFETVGEATSSAIDITKPWARIAFDIFVHNVVIMYAIACSGLIYWAFPAVVLGVNGFVIGLVVGKAYQLIGILGVLVAFLPHGIFELSAMVITSSIGIAYNKQAFIIVKARDWSKLKKVNLELLWLVTKTVLPLTIVAALIEGFLIGVLV